MHGQDQTVDAILAIFILVMKILNQLLVVYHEFYEQFMLVFYWLRTYFLQFRYELMYHNFVNKYV